jgi:hypothetical protein
MKPVTVTITDEIAYQAYLEAAANGVCFELGDAIRDLANHVPTADTDEVKAFSAHLDDLVGHFIDTGIWRQYPKSSPERKHWAKLAATREVEMPSLSELTRAE